MHVLGPATPGSRAWSVAEAEAFEKLPGMATVVPVHVTMFWQPGTVHASQSLDDSCSIPGSAWLAVCSHAGLSTAMCEHTAGALNPAA